MLAYLDSLCAALLARDSTEIQRLLALPAARDLPRRVREEAVAISRAGNRSFMAPIHALHFYYKLTHMVMSRAIRSSVMRRSRASQRADKWSCRSVKWETA